MLFHILNINFSIVHMKYAFFDFIIFQDDSQSIVLPFKINPTKWRHCLNGISSQDNSILHSANNPHRLGTHLHIILPERMRSVKIVNGNNVAISSLNVVSFTSIRIWFNLDSAPCSTMWSSNMNSVLISDVIRRFKHKT